MNNSKYSNILLTIIAACLLFQVVNSLGSRKESPLAVIVKGFDIGDKTVPVELSGESDVNITGIALSAKSLVNPNTPLPVQIVR